MSIMKSFKIELLKLKHSFIKYVLVSPLIISALLINVDLYFRRNSIISKYSGHVEDGFYALIIENHLALIWPMLLLIFIVILSISLFYIDLKNNCLTHLFANPLKRKDYYLSKFLLILLSTILVIIFEGIILVISAKAFSLSSSIDMPLLIRYMWFQIFCSVGIISFEIFLFCVIMDVLLVSSINIVFICGSIAFLSNPSIIRYNPYLHFINSTPFSNPILLTQSILWSLIYMLIFTILGLLYFKYRDIKED